jgi:phage terminase small subunit
MRGLTLSQKEKRFIDNYTNIANKETYDNALQSYKQAGYKAKNDNVAGQGGFKLLKKGKIAMAIKQIEAEREMDLSLEVDEHIKTISNILSQIKSKGKYSREDLAAARFLAECAGKIGGNAVNVQNNIAVLGQARLESIIAESRTKAEAINQAERDRQLSQRGDA